MPSSKIIRKAAGVLILSSQQYKKEIKRKYWVRDWILRREAYGAYKILLTELRLQDAQQFKSFIRISAVDLENLLMVVGNKIKKQDTHLRASISAGERLVVTLRFLATGDSYNSLMYLFRIPACTMSKFIPEVCSALYEELKEQYLKVPTKSRKWLQHAKQFEDRWNFPHCIGALDGKHIVIQAPINSGSNYYNYKGSYSIVLMGLVDASYKFIYVDIGCNGRISDGGVFNNCSLSSALENNRVDLPEPTELPGRTKPVPYVVVADDAFAMKPYLMKPYPFRDQPGPNRVFNYRLSRSRRIVENCFGILANRFRVLRKPILLQPQNAKAVVLAICALHNFLMVRNDSVPIYAPPGTFDKESAISHDIIHGEWRNEGDIPTQNLLPLQGGVNHNYSMLAKEVREEFKEYFMTPHGEVPWQYKFI